MTQQAETYPQMMAVCPNCTALTEVEWCDETVDGLEEWQCEHCSTDFTYCHPLNNYGLAV